MADESGLLHWILTGLIGVLATGVGYFLNITIERLDAVEDATADNKLDLANFKTHVSDNYAKDASVQHQLARIHDRIDSGFEELRADIKALIGRSK